MRTKALKSVVPEYPLSSQRNQTTGVSVVEVKTARDGTVRDVTVLECPDAAIGAAMTRAARQWSFPPLKVKGERAAIVFKLTFYFRKNASGFSVESPRAVSASAARELETK
jgi:TonB family protein